jgi:uncharacterized protein YbjT (DUF2867 family)
MAVIAVMGAAGNVGGKVADLLLREGEQVRVLQHRRDLTGLAERGAEVVEGDALDVEALRAFFKGATSALVLLPEDVADPAFVENRSRMSRAIRDALRATGVTHVVLLSFVGAARADAPGPPAGLHEFERLLGELSVNVLTLRSAMYMDYLLASLPLMRAQGVNGSAIRGDVRIPMVATKDVAREAADRLRRRDFTGHEVKLLLGPEDLTMTDVTRAIGARLGMPDLPYVQLPAEGVRAALVGAGMAEEVAGLIVAMQLALNEGLSFDGVQRTATSATPTRFVDILRERLPHTGEPA